MQDPRIKNYMAARRRAWKQDNRPSLDFPQWVEGMTTARYVALWERNRHLIPTVPPIDTRPVNPR
jgi:hypothetical protein